MNAALIVSFFMVQLPKLESSITNQTLNMGKLRPLDSPNVTMMYLEIQLPILVRLAGVTIQLKRMSELMLMLNLKFLA